MFTLVAGTGYTGKRVLERLPRDEVVGLSRTAIDTDRPFHVLDFDALQELPCAMPDEYAVLYTSPPDGPVDQRLRNLVGALPHAPARFVYISSTGVYGDCGGAVVTENSPLKPGTRMSKPRVDAENFLATWGEKTGCDLVVLRAPGIYGPGRLGIQRMQTGEAVLREADANPGNRIHVDDLASCCLAALHELAPAGIYNVGDGDHRTSTWFNDAVARAAGLPEPRKISRAEAAVEFSPRRLAFLSSSRRVDTTKMRKVLGIIPRSPEQGIRDSIRGR